MLWLLLVVLLVWAVTRFYLRGEDLSAYDTPAGQSFSEGREASPENAEVIASFAGMTQLNQGVSRKKQLAQMREFLDGFGKDVSFDGEIIAVDTAGLKGEWLVPAGADTSIRTLYIHGGAFLMGSPLSHRAVTTRYAAITGGVVFSLDYRLMPEHRRQAGIDDCRAAYRWMLDNGPRGRATATTVFISGDSAGGNLTLALSSWIRDQGLRAPNAVVALSPATDGTYSSPSLRANIATDHMLGPAFGKMGRIPGWILRWGAWFTNRISPSNPSVSPVFGDLSGLPPTLVQVSEVEMLCDDGRRYVNKARASGSPAQLQSWNHVVHVWQMFHEKLPEGQEAFAEIENFLQANGSVTRQESAA